MVAQLTTAKNEMFVDMWADIENVGCLIGKLSICCSMNEGPFAKENKLTEGK